MDIPFFFLRESVVCMSRGERKGDGQKDREGENLKKALCLAWIGVEGCGGVSGYEE